MSLISMHSITKTKVVRLGCGLDTDDEDDTGSVPFGYVQETTPVMAPRALRVRAVDTSLDDILAPRPMQPARSRAAWNSETNPVAVTRTSFGKDRQHLRNNITNGNNQDSGCEDATTEGNNMYAESKQKIEDQEKRAADIEIRRLRCKVTEMEKMNQSLRLHTTVQRRPSQESMGSSNSDGSSPTSSSTDDPMVTPAIVPSSSRVSRHSSGRSGRSERSLNLQEAPAVTTTTQPTIPTAQSTAPPQQQQQQNLRFDCFPKRRSVPLPSPT
eukprot:m.94135 g.94135  ORF g.94135 m.94135 type:complete len:270 (-) comp10035_c4_seq1:2466-3275(-)